MEQQALIPQIKDEAARRAKRAIFPSMICVGGGGSRFSTYFVQDRSPVPINNDKHDKKDKSPFVVFKLSFILAFHLRTAFNSLNYVPPRKPRLPVMILHRQMSDILQVSYYTKFMTLAMFKMKVTQLCL